MRTVLTLCLALATVLGAGNVWASEINSQRARFNYQMSCQGCHAPDGSGATAVPRMRDQVGYFLGSEAGREYLVRVPGSATSALSDADLAEVLNWIMREFAGASVEGTYTPYTTAEVAQLRRHPLNEVVQYRAQLWAEIARAKGGD